MKSNQDQSELEKLNNLVLKLYTRMEERFDQLDKKKADKEQMDKVLTILDGIAKRQDSDDQELAAISAQLDRHETWIGQLAKKTHTKLATEL